MFIPFGRSAQPPVSQAFVMGRAWIPHEGSTQRLATLGIFAVLTTLHQPRAYFGALLCTGALLGIAIQIVTTADLIAISAP